MADIAALGLVEADPIDYENEAVNTGGGSNYAPPPEGKYFGKVNSIPDDAIGKTTQDYLKISLPEIEITGPTGQGYKIRYQMPLSAKKYSNREGNSILDFLRACGLPMRPKTNAEYVAAVKMAVNRPFPFILVWEGYDKDNQITIKGAENFPPDPLDSSKRQPFVEIPDPNDDSKTKRIWANGKVKSYISAVTKGA